MSHITKEYLCNLQKEYKTNPQKFLIERYKNMILECAKRGGHKFDIIDIHETNIQNVIEKLQEIFIDISFEIVEYSNPIMVTPQKMIRITW